MANTDVTMIVQEMLKKARVAQVSYGNSTQKQIDKAARICAKTVYDNAEILAEEAVAETNMGSVEGKIGKMQTAMKAAWQFTKGEKSTGVIGWEKGKLDVDCILKIAKPAGVIAAVTPSTNPTANIGFNSMQVLKGGNAVIFCPHPSAKNVSLHCVQMVRDNLEKAGFSPDLVQCVAEPTIETTQEVMKVCDLNVATGGAGMVKAALSCGKPSFGVGQGNCQALVDKGMNDMFDEIAEGTVFNRQFDSGIPCTGEQSIIVPEKDKEEMIAAFERAGTFVIRDKETVDKMRNLLFLKNEETGEYTMNRHAVGRPAQELGERVGIQVPEGKKILMLVLDNYGKDELLCREKLCVVSNLISYSGDWEECVHIAKSNLLVEGTGHSADIYTKNEDHQLHAGLELPVCRLIVNMSNLATFGVPYSGVGLIPTHGLGCGFWQGNTTGEHVNFEHFLNITRVVYKVESGIPELSTEEVWAE